MMDITTAAGGGMKDMSFISGTSFILSEVSSEGSEQGGLQQQMKRNYNIHDDDENSEETERVQNTPKKPAQTTTTTALDPDVSLISLPNFDKKQTAYANNTSASFVISDDGDVKSLSSSDPNTNTNMTMSPITPMTNMRRNTMQLALQESLYFTKQIDQLKKDLENTQELHQKEFERRQQLEHLLKQQNNTKDTENNQPSSCGVVSPTSNNTTSKTKQTQALSPTTTTAKLMDRNTTLVKEVRFADQTCVELSEKNIALQNDLLRVEQDLTECKSELREKNESLQNLLKQNGMMEVKVGQSLAELEKNTERYENSMEEKQILLEKLEAKHQDLLGKYEKVSKDKAVLQHQVFSGDKQIQSLTKQLETLQNKQEQNPPKTPTSTVLANTLKTEIGRTRQASQQIRELEKSLGRAQSELKQVEKERDITLKKTETLENQVKELQIQLNSAEQNPIISVLQQEKTNLEEELSICKSYLQTCETQLNATLEETEHFKHLASSLQLELSQTRKDLERVVILKQNEQDAFEYLVRTEVMKGMNLMENTHCVLEQIVHEKLEGQLNRLEKLDRFVDKFSQNKKSTGGSSNPADAQDTQDTDVDTSLYTNCPMKLLGSFDKCAEQESPNNKSAFQDHSFASTTSSTSTSTATDERGWSMNCTKASELIDDFTTIMEDNDGKDESLNQSYYSIMDTPKLAQRMTQQISSILIEAQQAHGTSSSATFSNEIIKEIEENFTTLLQMFDKSQLKVEEYKLFLKNLQKVYKREHDELQDKIVAQEKIIQQLQKQKQPSTTTLSASSEEMQSLRKSLESTRLKLQMCIRENKELELSHTKFSTSIQKHLEKEQRHSNELQLKLQRYQEENMELQQQQQQQQQRVSVEAENSSEEIQELEQRCNEIEQVAIDLKDENTSLLQKNSDLKEKLEIQTDEKADLRNCVKRLNESLDGKREECNNIKQELNECKRSLTSTNTQLKESEKETQKIRSELHQMDINHTKQEDHWKEILMEKDALLQEIQSISQQELDLMKTTYEKKISSRENKMKELQHLVLNYKSDMASNKREEDRKNLRITNLLKQIQKLEKDSSSDKSKTDEIVFKLKNEIDLLKKAKVDLEHVTTQYVKQIDELQSEIDSLEKTHNGEARKLKDNGEQIQQVMNEKIDLLRKQLDESTKNAAAQTTIATATNASMERKCVHLKEYVTKLTNKCQEWSERYKKLSNEMNLLVQEKLKSEKLLESSHQHHEENKENSSSNMSSSSSLLLDDESTLISLNHGGDMRKLSQECKYLKKAVIREARRNSKLQEEIKKRNVMLLNHKSKQQKQPLSKMTNNNEGSSPVSSAVDFN